MADLDRELKQRIVVESEGTDAFAQTAAGAKELDQSIAEIEQSLDARISELDALFASFEQQFGSLKTAAESLGEAKKPILEFVAAVKEGSEGIERKAGRAKLALQEVRAAAEELRQSGTGMTEAQQRELERLEDSYEGAIAAAGRYKAAQAEARREIREATASQREFTGSINDLGDIVSRASPKLSALALKGGAVVGAFSAGYAAGNKFREILGAIDRVLGTSLLPTLNKAVTGFFHLEEAAEAWVLEAESQETQLQNHTNLYKVLVANGIDPATLSIEQQRAALAKLKLEQAQQTGAIVEVDKAFQTWTTSLGINRAELDAQVNTLESNLQKLTASGAKLDEQELGEKLKPRIQALLDLYEAFGEVPPKLQAIADRFGVVSSAAEASARSIEDLQRRTSASLAKTAKDAGTSREDIRKALKTLTPADIELLSPKLKEQVATELIAARDKVTLHGGEFTEKMSQQAARVALLIPAFTTPFKELTAAAGDGLSDLTTKGDGSGQVVADAATGLESLSTATAALKTGDAATVVTDIATALQTLGAGIDTTGFDGFVNHVIAGLKNISTQAKQTGKDLEDAFKVENGSSPGDTPDAG